MTLEYTTPRPDTGARCDACRAPIVWDEVHGWTHVATGEPATSRAHHAAIGPMP